MRGGRGGEMSAARLGGVAGGGLKIPPTAMEVVRSLKEIVENSDDEIYATLKECNMDLNETAQRLLNQGNEALPFLLANLLDTHSGQHCTYTVCLWLLVATAVIIQIFLSLIDAFFNEETAAPRWEIVRGTFI